MKTGRKKFIRDFTLAYKENNHFIPVDIKTNALIVPRMHIKILLYCNKILILIATEALMTKSMFIVYNLIAKYIITLGCFDI